MPEIKDYYERFWDRTGDVSDTDCTTAERKQRLLFALQRYVKPGDKVLDLGCGAGKFTAWVKAAGYDCVGMDLSEAALEMARRQAPEGSFAPLNADGTIPAPEAAFAAVWATEVIEHVLDVPAFLAEIRRVLRPGGILILTTPYHGRLKNLAVMLLKFDAHFDPEGAHIRFFDRKGLQRCLTKAGLIPLSWSGIGRFWKLYRTWFVVAKKAGGTESRP